MASWQAMRLPQRLRWTQGKEATRLTCHLSHWVPAPGLPLPAICPPSPPPAEGLRSPASVTLQAILLPGVVGGESISFCLLLAGRWASGQRLGLRTNLLGHSGTHTRKRATDP